MYDVLIQGQPSLTVKSLYLTKLINNKKGNTEDKTAVGILRWLVFFRFKEDLHNLLPPEKWA